MTLNDNDNVYEIDPAKQAAIVEALSLLSEFFDVARVEGYELVGMSAVRYHGGFDPFPAYDMEPEDTILN